MLTSGLDELDGTGCPKRPTSGTPVLTQGWKAKTRPCRGLQNRGTPARELIWESEESAHCVPSTFQSEFLETRLESGADTPRQVARGLTPPRSGRGCGEGAFGGHRELVGGADAGGGVLLEDAEWGGGFPLFALGAVEAGHEGGLAGARVGFLLFFGSHDERLARVFADEDEVLVVFFADLVRGVSGQDGVH
ncbi:MAG: hypothetical protein JWP89_3166 [Schlesneria sp.]|nr:hypothetical protein [Schlesneria sp.]